MIASLYLFWVQIHLSNVTTLPSLAVIYASSFLSWFLNLSNAPVEMMTSFPADPAHSLARLLWTSKGPASYTIYSAESQNHMMVIKNLPYQIFQAKCLNLPMTSLNNGLPLPPFSTIPTSCKSWLASYTEILPSQSSTITTSQQRNE